MKKIDFSFLVPNEKLYETKEIILDWLGTGCAGGDCIYDNIYCDDFGVCTECIRQHTKCSLDTPYSEIRIGERFYYKGQEYIKSISQENVSLKDGTFINIFSNEMVEKRGDKR